VLEVLGGDEVCEVRLIAGYVAAVAHLHEEVEQGHVYAAEEAVYLAMGGFIQVAVVPKSSED